MKIIDMIKKKIASRRIRKAKKMFCSAFKATYPDAFDFIERLKRVDFDGCRMPYFLLSASLMSKGALSSNSTADSSVREVLMEEIGSMLKERSHRLDKFGVRVDGLHKDGYFVLQIRFRELPGIEQD